MKSHTLQPVKTFLLIQSRVSSEAQEREALLFARSLHSGANLRTLSTLDAKLPWSEPEELLHEVDGVLIGGSGDFDLHGGRADVDPARSGARAILKRLEPLIAHVLEHDFPTMGICFGHQLIAEVQGGNVVHDKRQSKWGTHDVVLHDNSIDDDFLSVAPKLFEAQYGHNDSISELPQGAVLLAQSPSCHFSVLRYGKNVYTTQFHPELCAEDMRERLTSLGEYLPHAAEAATSVRDSHSASSLLQRFVDRIVH